MCKMPISGLKCHLMILTYQSSKLLISKLIVIEYCLFLWRKPKKIFKIKKGRDYW